MKGTIKLVTLLLSLFLFYSCSSDDDTSREITFKVYTSNSESIIQIQATETPLIRTQGSWEKTFKSDKDTTIGLQVYCEDRNTLLTGEIYVNGIKKTTQEGNSNIGLILEN